MIASLPSGARRAVNPYAWDVAEQRRLVREVDGWRDIEELAELYRAARPWSKDDARRFKDLAGMG